MADRVRRQRVTPRTRDEIADAVVAALGRRVAKHGDGAFVGPHEGLGVVTEEFHELVEACRSNDRRRVRDEAMDVAIGALWMVASIGELPESGK